MRKSIISFLTAAGLVLALVLAGGCKTGADDNSFVGTWYWPTNSTIDSAMYIVKIKDNGVWAAWMPITAQSMSAYQAMQYGDATRFGYGTWAPNTASGFNSAFTEILLTGDPSAQATQMSPGAGAQRASVTSGDQLFMPQVPVPTMGAMDLSAARYSTSY